MELQINQASWDSCLMLGWQKHKSIGWVVRRYLRRYGFVESTDSYDKAVVELTNSAMLRCSTFNINSLGVKRRRINMKQPVRVFIAERSPKLSNALFDGLTTIEALFSINNFNWEENRTQKDKSTRNYVSKKRFVKVRVAILARENDHSSDWSVTK